MPAIDFHNGINRGGARDLWRGHAPAARRATHAARADAPRPELAGVSA
jgi:hypothetical protein